MTSTTYIIPKILATVTILLVATSAAVQATGDHHLRWWTPTSSSSICNGSVDECLNNNNSEEFLMEPEISRRILATSKYISYGALQRNTVPCSRRGASYYNCRSGGQANPYSRGCSAITRCRS